MKTVLAGGKMPPMILEVGTIWHRSTSTYDSPPLPSEIATLESVVQHDTLQTASQTPG